MRIEFVRYGGLSSVRQRGYDPAMPTFHAPPARRGVYAFVAEAVAAFLLSKETFDSRRMEWVRDAAGRRVPADSDAAAALKRAGRPHRFLVHAGPDGVLYLARHKRPKYFHHDGELWHHLPVPRNEVLLARGSWVLTTAADHAAAYRRAVGPNQSLWDVYEVFIEKV